MTQKTHVIDATNRVLGRLATDIVCLLRGKHKPNFVPYLDQGDKVVVENVDKIKITGKKLEQKKYYRHSGYPGGLKVTPLKELFKKNPALVLQKAVYKMLARNKLRKGMMKRLIIT